MIWAISPTQKEIQPQPVHRHSPWLLHQCNECLWPRPRRCSSSKRSCTLKRVTDCYCIMWVIVMGVSHYFVDNHSPSNSWMAFHCFVSPQNFCICWCLIYFWGVWNPVSSRGFFCWKLHQACMILSYSLSDNQKQKNWRDLGSMRSNYSLFNAFSTLHKTSAEKLKTIDSAELATRTSSSPRHSATIPASTVHARPPHVERSNF